MSENPPGSVRVRVRAVVVVVSVVSYALEVLTYATWWWVVCAAGVRVRACVAVVVVTGSP